METWYKFWQCEKQTSKLWIPGDTIYISTKGRVKLNDELLTLGHGLWMTKNGEIRIVMCGLGEYKTIYRFIYTKHVDPSFNGGHNLQLHHIDRDHSNNDVNNIIKLTTQEHLKVHSTDGCDEELMERLNELKQYYKSHADRAKEYIETFKKYLRDRYNKYHKEILLCNEEQRKHKREQQKIITAQRKEEHRKQKLEEQQKLIDAGTHFRAADGRLMSYEQIRKMHETPRDLSYITDEWKEKQRQKQKELAALGIQTGRGHTPETEAQRKRNISKAIKNYYSKISNT